MFPTSGDWLNNCDRERQNGHWWLSIWTGKLFILKKSVQSVWQTVQMLCISVQNTLASVRSIATSVWTVLTSIQMVSTSVWTVFASIHQLEMSILRPMASVRMVWRLFCSFVWKEKIALVVSPVSQYSSWNVTTHIYVTKSRDKWLTQPSF